MYFDGEYRSGLFTKENLVRDIEEEFKVNGASPAVPPLQTKTNLYERMQHKTNWKEFVFKNTR